MPQMQADSLSKFWDCCVVAIHWADRKGWKRPSVKECALVFASKLSLVAISAPAMALVSSFDPSKSVKSQLTIPFWIFHHFPWSKVLRFGTPSALWWPFHPGWSAKLETVQGPVRCSSTSGCPSHPSSVPYVAANSWRRFFPNIFQKVLNNWLKLVKSC